MRAGLWIDREDPAFQAAASGLAATATPAAIRPQAIARPTSVAEVARCVREAGRRGLKVGIRSGGHGLTTPERVEPMMVLDLRQLRAAAVLPDGHGVRFGAGHTALTAAQFLDGHRLSFPVGHSPQVGLGGFLLAGGNGWAAGDLGAACHRLLAATMVTGDGEIRHVDDASDAATMRILRGGGPAVPAVVTALELLVEPLDTIVARTVIALPLTDATAIGSALDQLDPLTPGRELTMIIRPGGINAGIAVVVTDFLAPGRVPGTMPVGGVSTVTLGPFPGRGELLQQIPDFATDAQTSHHVWTAGGWSAAISALPLDVPGPAPRSSMLLSRSPADGPFADRSLYRPGTGIGVSVYAHWSATDRTRLEASQWCQRMLAGLPGSAAGRYIGEADLAAGPGVIHECLSDNAISEINAVRLELDPQRRVSTILDHLPPAPPKHELR